MLVCRCSAGGDGCLICSMMWRAAGWLKNIFFWRRAGGDIFFARARRAHLHMPRIRLILQIKKNQGKVLQADKRGGKVIFCRLVSYVDRNTNSGMIQPPQLFFSCNSPASVGVLHLFGVPAKGVPPTGGVQGESNKS